MMKLCTCSGLLLSAVIIMHASSVIGFLQIKQALNNNPGDRWTVEGLATYEVGFDPPIYDFQCLDTENNAVQWVREAGLMKSIVTVTNGVSMQFTGPTEADSGIYTCQNSMASLPINITLANPAVQAITPNITVFINESVTIGFYASGSPRLMDSQLIWKHNGAIVSSGNFTSNRRKLTLSNIAFTDGGVYTLTVASVTANTILTVLALPSILLQPATGSLDLLEWESFTLTCLVTSPLHVVVNWFKGDSLLDSHSHGIMITVDVLNDTIVHSTLTINDTRLSDSGLYRCNVTFDDLARFVLSDTVQVSISDNLRLVYTEGSSIVLSSPLLRIETTPFSIECQGTGILYWTNSTGHNITGISAHVPYQETTNSLFQRLNFTSFTPTDEGLYTCHSNFGLSTDIFVTKNNPAVYAPLSVISLTSRLISNMTINVYISGADPEPSASDISWYRNGALINTSQTSFYQFDSSKTILTITDDAPSNIIIGSYEVVVITSQGNSSAFIKITYTDAPVVNIEASSSLIDISEGTSVTLNCTVNSELNYTINWMHNGAYINATASVLTLDSLTRYDSGLYECVVSDGIRNTTDTVELNIIYSPVVVIRSNSNDDLMNITITEFNIFPDMIYCTASGNPLPNVFWMYDDNFGIIQNKISDNTVALQWNRPIKYSDEGRYHCIANNTVNSTIASLSVLFNVSANIYSIYPQYPVTTVYNMTFNDITMECPQVNSDCLINCVVRGLPVPSVVWKDDLGNVLNSSIITRPNGIVIATLNESGNGRYWCEAVDEYQSVRHSIRLVTSMKPASPVHPISPIINNKLRLRILTDSCTINGLVNSLRQVALLNYEESSVNITDWGCESNGATVIVLRASSNNVTSSLVDWWRSWPSVLINQTLYVVDQECALVVRESDPPLACTPSTSSITPSTTITSSTSSITITTTIVPVTTTLSPTPTNNITLDPEFQMILIVIVGSVLLLISIIILLFTIIGWCYFNKNCKYCRRKMKRSPTAYELEAVDNGIPSSGQTHYETIPPINVLQTATTNNQKETSFYSSADNHDKGNKKPINIYDQVGAPSEYAQINPPESSSPTSRVMQVDIKTIFNPNHNKVKENEAVKTAKPSPLALTTKPSPLYHELRPQRPDRGTSPDTSASQNSPFPYIKPVPSTHTLPKIKPSPEVHRSPYRFSFPYNLSSHELSETSNWFENDIEDITTPTNISDQQSQN